MLGAARAWDRLRVSGAAIRPEEAQAARAARGAVGHALRDARYRRAHDEDRFGIPYPGAAAQPRPLSLRPPSRLWIQVLSAFGLIALFLVIFYFPPALPGGLPAAPLGAQPSVAPTALTGGGRGRTSATSVPVVIVQPTGIPTPATPAPATTASPSPNAGTGTGTGVGSLPPRLSTDDRFIFVVIDSDTNKPIQGVCVTYGNECVADVRRTNAQGVFWVDFQRGVARLWLFEFWMPGYEPQGRQVPYVPGEATEPIEIRLRRVS